MREICYDTSRTDERLTVHLRGELDLHIAPELRRLFDAELSDVPAEVVVDLEKTAFIDSSIIATLVVALKRTLEQGSRFRVVNARQNVRDTFEIAGLLDRFGIE